MKILLADDHQLFLEGLQSVLIQAYRDIEIEFAHHGDKAFELLSDGTFDIALIDLRLPRMDGFDLLTELTKINCLTPIIIVTASEDPLDEERIIDLGAMGFVPKSSTGQQIIDAIHCVLEGGISRFQGYHNHPQENWATLHNLTPRQLEVLRLIRHGLSNQEIANELCLSTATIKTHIISIFQSLGAQNRTEAVRKAQQLGLD